MSWSLTLPAQIRFGRGAAAEAAADARAITSDIVLVRGRSSVFADTLTDALRQAGCRTTVIEGRGEPTLAHVTDAAARARDAGARAVVAIGGGSVIDLGKAVAGLAPQSGDPLRHLEGVGDGAPLAVDPLPLIALPTTAGTGSEATKNAVIGVPEAGRKVSLRDMRLLPRLAIVDPALTDGCPWPVTLASGLDAIVQVIEPYLSARANPVTDALCRDAIPAGLRALRRLAEADDPQARDILARVSLTGGIALANAGLGAVHGLAGVIGGRTGLAHGAICGRLLVPVLRTNRAALEREARSTDRIAEVEAWIAGAFATDGGRALDTLVAWIDDQGLPRLPRDGHADLAQAAASASSMQANPVALTMADLQGALSAAA